MTKTSAIFTAVFAAATLITAVPATAQITLEKRSTSIALDPDQIPADIFDESAAEIVAYDKSSRRLFIVNGANNTIDVIDIQDIDNPNPVVAIDLSPYGDSVTSVAVDPRRNRHEIAVAVTAEPVSDPGSVVFFDTDGTFINQVTVGALPDMLTYDKFGRQVIVANEGEPDEVDPEGSVAIIENRRGAAGIDAGDVHIVEFTELNSMAGELQGAGVRLFPDLDSVAQDLEPEYIAISPNSRKAFVTLQEANSIAVIDLRQRRLLEVFSLGLKDHSLPGNALDGSDKDDLVNISNWPVHGMFMPDGITSFRRGKQTYIITANEGDDRGEDERIEDLTLDPTAFPNAAALQTDAAIGRLGVSTIDGDIDGDGDYDRLQTYGARSFTIWTEQGEMVFDSGDDFERITADAFPDHFNASNDDNEFDARSDNKGPEPESVEIGRVGSRLYAFIGLERIGGIMIYDITRPRLSFFVDYINNRDFDADPELNEAGDLGPEGLKFIPAAFSPSHRPLLVVANEVSGTTTIYEVVRSHPRPKAR